MRKEYDAYALSKLAKASQFWDIDFLLDWVVRRPAFRPRAGRVRWRQRLLSLTKYHSTKQRTRPCARKLPIQNADYHVRTRKLGWLRGIVARRNKRSPTRKQQETAKKRRQRTKTRKNRQQDRDAKYSLQENTIQETEWFTWVLYRVFQCTGVDCRFLSTEQDRSKRWKACFRSQALEPVWDFSPTTPRLFVALLDRFPPYWANWHEDYLEAMVREETKQLKENMERQLLTEWRMRV